jgi:hypothetical protein
MPRRARLAMQGMVWWWMVAVPVPTVVLLYLIGLMQ